MSCVLCTIFPPGEKIICLVPRYFNKSMENEMKMWMYFGAIHAHCYFQVVVQVRKKHITQWEEMDRLLRRTQERACYAVRTPLTMKISNNFLFQFLAYFLNPIHYQVTCWAVRSTYWYRRLLPVSLGVSIVSGSSCLAPNWTAKVVLFVSGIRAQAVDAPQTRSSVILRTIAC